MNPRSAAADSWTDLFMPGELRHTLHAVRRGGEPFLLLPSPARLATRALALYPAQTAKARAAKIVLHLALRLGLKPGLEPVSASVAGDDPFWHFLIQSVFENPPAASETAFGVPPSGGSPAVPPEGGTPNESTQTRSQTAGLPAGVPPRFAILAGNPRATGRRFVLLLFNADGDPAAVVKAGVSDDARRLLAHEEDFLRSLPEGRRGLPTVRGTFDSPRVRAFALDFFEGESPRADETAALSDLLGSWIVTDREVTMRELDAWRRLADKFHKPIETSTVRSRRREEADLHKLAPNPPPHVGGYEAWETSWLEALAEARFHPVMSHGDFTPWNVKVARGQWTVLDWERGEPMGVPGWDWFHFVLQPALLVRRESTDALLLRLENLFRSAAFTAYAERAGIKGRERALALAYLAYGTRVTKQTEGLDRLAALEAAAAAHWFPTSR